MPCFIEYTHMPSFPTLPEMGFLQIELLYRQMPCRRVMDCTLHYLTPLARFVLYRWYPFC